MARVTPGTRRRFRPSITFLEPRRLLANVTSLGQAGVDLVGPDASQGPDGIQDLHLRMTALAGAVEQITVQAPGGFAWATGPDASGAALAEYFPSSTAGSGDLYLNPQVRSDLPPPGGTLPLGGSTGSLISISNGLVLTLLINYQGQSRPETATLPVSGLVSATAPMPEPSVPANVVNAIQMVDLGQDGTGQFYEQGFVHLVATATSGLVFDRSTFGQVVWELGDQAGLAWDSTAATVGHNHVYASLRTGTNDVVDLYFPPMRNEAPASGSTSPSMTLLTLVPGVSTVYATTFAGGNWNVAERANSLNSQPPPSPAPSTEAQLRALLASTSPEYDTIDLPASATIIVTQPLEITHSVAIIGNNSRLLFEQGSSAAWPASASGAIYVNAPAYTNIRLTLSGFTISFDMSAPIRWSNPSGAGPAFFDPENNPLGVVHAVVDTRDSNINLNLTSLALSNMQIDGPPAFDGATFGTLSSQAGQSVGSGALYAGELAMDLVRTNDLDTGSISNSVFQGGSIELYGGPWKITGNTVFGSMAETYSAAAFALHSAHDVTIAGNQVTQSNPSGHEFRLVALAVSGYDNLVEGNSFGGGAGATGNEVTYSSSSGGFSGINDPEVILAESSFGVLFEGRPGAVSADGRLLVLPDVRAWAAAGSTGPGLVVSILGKAGAGGVSQAAPAGEWFRVALQVSLSASNTIELLMEDPLPTSPDGGYYIVEVTSGFVNTFFENNHIDLAGKSSIGLVLNGADYGSRITGNVFLGGSSGSPVYTQTAISVTSLILSAASGTGAFPLPEGWTALPDLGTVVQGNTIRDFLGGIVVGVQHFLNYWEARVESSSETGRVFVTASVTGNVFEYDAAFLDAWSATCASFGNDPAETSSPPPVTIGSGWSAQAPGPYGSPRFPWTLGAADIVNGADSPIFVDPAENVVTVQTNTVETIGSSGAITTETGALGQVYAGVVNGTVVAPELGQQSYEGQPYNPFNLMNLDVGSGADPPPPPVPPPPPAAPPGGIAAPTGVVGREAGANQIALSWNGSVVADHYVVERSTTGVSWAVVAPWVTTTSFVDAGLAYATTYSYCVVAVASSGATALSSVVTVATGQQPDVISAVVSSLRLNRGIVFSGPVASVTDTNATTSASQFVATINWGDGKFSRATVTGGAGSFVVDARHAYARNGRYTVSVTVTMTGSSFAGADASATAVVSKPAKHLARARVIHRLLKKPAKPVNRRRK
jgi:hypothetical protein